MKTQKQRRATSPSLPAFFFPVRAKKAEQDPEQRPLLLGRKEVQEAIGDYRGASMFEVGEKGWEARRTVEIGDEIRHERLRGGAGWGSEGEGERFELSMIVARQQRV